MSKARSVYRCGECGHPHAKWAGRCEGCGAWNTIAEEPETIARAHGRTGAPGRSHQPGDPAPVALSEIQASKLVRWKTGIAEFDFVLGGGLVPGSLILVGGEPGIGKSTLLLQAVARLEESGRRTLYVSGEESPEQVRLRAERLEEPTGEVHVLGETRLESILTAASKMKADVMVLDSIQTVYAEVLEGAPGSVGQVRECAAMLMRYAKETGAAVFVVGHVTKGGTVAGPKTLEHIVDTVLYFEGEGMHDYRLLRATKNRFGSVDEVGVFAMTERGLIPEPSPSALFLSARAPGTSGSAVTALLEGTRPMLVEVQALAARSTFGTPQRVATGLDHKRLAVLLAVLERRGGTSFADLDVFVQASAGVRLVEPGADLAVAAALLSSVMNRPAADTTLFLGEIGLGGEVRPVTQVERRLIEAARMGFKRAVISSRRPTGPLGPLAVVGIDHIDALGATLAA